MGCHAATIAGATGTTYTLTKSELGKRISVEVTASATGRHSSVFSPSTSPVVK